MQHRLIILSGPSGIGKSPLFKALKRDYPELTADWEQVTLYNSRDPRPGEVDGEDYHFRKRDEIEELRDRDSCTVMEVRGDLQALDAEELRDQLRERTVVFEGNPMVGSELLSVDLPEGVERLAIFISPLSAEEVEWLRDGDNGADAEEVLTEFMRRKLLRRMTRQKGVLGQPDLDEVERRAGSAWRELGMASRFDFVVPNPDGEDSENWDGFACVLGAARRTLLTVVALIRGEAAPHAERWDDSLVG